MAASNVKKLDLIELILNDMSLEEQEQIAKELNLSPENYACNEEFVDVLESKLQALTKPQLIQLINKVAPYHLQ